MRKSNLVGDNIRRLRVSAGITQEDLALKSGLSQGYVNQLESGKRRFTQKSLEMVAHGLDVPLSELFRGEAPPPPPSQAQKSRKKRPDKKEFLTLLDSLPSHVIDHYLVLLRMENKIWEKKKG